MAEGTYRQATAAVRSTEVCRDELFVSPPIFRDCPLDAHYKPKADASYEVARPALVNLGCHTGLKKSLC